MASELVPNEDPQPDFPDKYAPTPDQALFDLQQYLGNLGLHLDQFYQEQRTDVAQGIARFSRQAVIALFANSTVHRPSHWPYTLPQTMLQQELEAVQGRTRREPGQRISIIRRYVSIAHEYSKPFPEVRFLYVVNQALNQQLNERSSSSSPQRLIHLNEGITDVMIAYGATLHRLPKTYPKARNMQLYVMSDYDF